MSGSTEFHISHDSVPEPTAPTYPPTKVTLSSLLGGSEAIDFIVNDVFDRVMADGYLTGFFLNAVYPDVKRKQCELFKTIAMECNAQDIANLGESLASENERLFALGMNENHFNLIMGHFVLTLETLGVTKPYIVECLKLIVPLRDSFVEGAFNARQKQAFARNSLNV